MSLYSSLTREIEDSPDGPQIGAFFDLDRTIIAGFSALVFIGNWILSGRMTPSGFMRTLSASLKYELGRLGFSAMVGETAGLLQGFSELEYERIGERIFSNWLAADIYPEARALIRAHQRKGHTLAVISSATRYQVDPVADDLGIEHVLCTGLEVVDGKFSGQVVHPTCFREGKASAAVDFSQRHGIELDDSFFYTDSCDDLALLRLVGRPRPVNPDRRLAAIAAKRGWPARNFVSRGRPRIADIARTALTLAALGPSFGLGIPAAYLDRDWRRAVNLGATTWGELGTALAGINVHVRGEEHLWSRRPAVFIFNHQSAIDVLLLCKLLRRDFIGITKMEVRSYPLLGPLFAAVGTVFIDRFTPGQASTGLQPAVEALADGLSVAIAPEGTRSPSLSPGPFKKGAFRLAMEAGVCIVPIIFRNALDALPKHGVVVRPATIEAVVLPPIDTRGWTLDTLDRHIRDVHALYEQTLEGE